MTKAITRVGPWAYLRDLFVLLPINAEVDAEVDARSFFLVC